MKITIIQTLHPSSIAPPVQGQHPDWIRSKHKKADVTWIWRVEKCDGPGFVPGERIRTLDIGLLRIGNHEITKKLNEKIIWPHEGGNCEQ